MLSLLAGLAVAAAPPPLDCSNLLAFPKSRRGHQAMTVRDLASLRDMGATVGWWGDESPFSLSPDSSTVAVQIRQVDRDNQGYCQALICIPIHAPGPIKLIDQGGFLLTRVQGLRNLRFPMGVAQINAPRWSPDGRSIAYLKNTGDKTQIWVADASGGASRAVTREITDIERFTWTSDGTGFIFTSHPAWDDAERKIDEEGKSGFLYDERFRPVAKNRPFSPYDVEAKYSVASLRTGNARDATDEEIARLKNIPVSATSYSFASSVGDKRAWTEPRDSSVQPEYDLHVQVGDGSPVTCPGKWCRKIIGMWWNGRGDQLRFLRLEGPASGAMGLYRWSLGHRRPVRIPVSDSWLTGCQAVGDDLLCVQEMATQPRRLVRINMRSGAMRMVFDPNPEFREFRLGEVTRYAWKNAFGMDSYADLVLPPDHRPGQRHPLIIVQYESKGFLRGGTGDEYPIYPLAAQGYAVLSFQRPRPISSLSSAQTWDEAERVDQKDFADRRNIHDSLLHGIHLLIDKGLVDPSRIGITGLSDGVSSAQYALLNSAIFSAAILSTCCEDPVLQNLVGGPATQADMENMGRPKLTEDYRPFWSRYSLAMNAAHVRVPILMQLSDSEYETALATYSYLKAYHQPVEMYVFPNERHIKWQPAHRLAIYERVIDWFNYWLRQKKDLAPRKKEQYVRWDQLRNQLKAEYRPKPHPDFVQELVQASASARSIILKKSSSRAGPLSRSSRSN